MEPGRGRLSYWSMGPCNSSSGGEACVCHTYGWWTLPPVCTIPVYIQQIEAGGHVNIFNKSPVRRKPGHLPLPPKQASPYWQEEPLTGLAFETRLGSGRWGDLPICGPLPPLPTAFLRLTNAPDPLQAPRTNMSCRLEAGLATLLSPLLQSCLAQMAPGPWGLRLLAGPGLKKQVGHQGPTLAVGMG